MTNENFALRKSWREQFSRLYLFILITLIYIFLNLLLDQEKKSRPWKSWRYRCLYIEIFVSEWVLSLWITTNCLVNRVGILPCLSRKRNPLYRRLTKCFRGTQITISSLTGLYQPNTSRNKHGCHTIVLFPVWYTFWIYFLWWYNLILIGTVCCLLFLKTLGS